MIKFTNGPAAGVSLLLRRAPLFLRAVQDAVGTWDALDQLEDVAHETEKLSCYVATERPSPVHLSMRDKRGRRTGGWYAMGQYELVEPQPSDEVMRDNDRWAEWCHAQPLPEWVNGVER